MNTHFDKTQDNKSHSVENKVSQKQSGIDSTFQFIDNRQESIIQKRLNDMAENSSEAKKIAQLKTITENYLTKSTKERGSADETPFQKEHNGKQSSEIVKTSSNTGTFQLKPKNIKNVQTLNVDNAGAITNPEAGRNDPPVSYPLNMAITKGILKSKDGSAVGGHLFKREYGGADDYSNVVTWSEKSEAKFTVFENQYLDKARTDATGKGGVAREVKTEATFTDFKVNLKNINLPDKPAPDGSLKKNRTIQKEMETKEGKEANYLLTNLISGGIESIPNSVKASSKGVKDWENSGKNEFMRIDESIDESQVAIRFDYLVDDVGEDKAQITRAVNKVKEM